MFYSQFGCGCVGGLQGVLGLHIITHFSHHYGCVCSLKHKWVSSASILSVSLTNYSLSLLATCFSLVHLTTHLTSNHSSQWLHRNNNPASWIHSACVVYSSLVSSSANSAIISCTQMSFSSCDVSTRKTVSFLSQG